MPRRNWSDAEYETILRWIVGRVGSRTTWENKNTPGGERTEEYHQLLDQVAEICHVKRTAVGWIVRDAIRGLPRQHAAAVRVGFLAGDR